MTKNKVPIWPVTYKKITKAMQAFNEVANGVPLPSENLIATLNRLGKKLNDREKQDNYLKEIAEDLGL